jgi:DNA polymerase-3 subunit beta
MRLVATDGHRLSLHDEPIRGVTFPVKVSGKDTAMRMRTESEVSWLVSLSAVGHIRRLVGAKPAKGEPSALATIGTDGKNLFVSCRGVDIATRLVEATFPPYAQVIPGSSERKAIVSREALLSALQAVSTCTSKRTGGIKLTFADGSVRLFASDPDEGEADEKVAASMGRGDGALCKLKPLTIGVNASYMLDALTVLASDEVTLATSGELDPIVVRGKDESTLAIVMPMRI